MIKQILALKEKTFHTKIVIRHYIYEGGITKQEDTHKYMKVELKRETHKVKTHITFSALID